MYAHVLPRACQKAREAVSLQLDGELSEVGTARLAAHLRSCDACAAYALELVAATTHLWMAPLEQPAIAFSLPSRRRRPVLGTAAAVVAAAAAASSIMLGHFGASPAKRAAPEPTRASETASVSPDIVDQHVLAMERRLVGSSVRVGSAIAI